MLNFYLIPRVKEKLFVFGVNVFKGSQCARRDASIQSINLNSLYWGYQIMTLICFDTKKKKKNRQT